MNRLQYLREGQIRGSLPLEYMWQIHASLPLEYMWQIRASLPLEYMCFRVKGLVEPQSLFTWKVFASFPLTLTQCR